MVNCWFTRKDSLATSRERNYTRPSTTKQIRGIQNLPTGYRTERVAQRVIWIAGISAVRSLSVLSLSHVMQYAQLITGLNSLRIQALYPARLGPERRDMLHISKSTLEVTCNKGTFSNFEVVHPTMFCKHTKTIKNRCQKKCEDVLHGNRAQATEIHRVC
eukprot:s1113_g20.t1